MARRPFPRGVSKKNAKSFDSGPNTDDPDIDFSGSFVRFVSEVSLDGHPAGGGIFLQGPDLSVVRVSTDENGEPLEGLDYSPAVSRGGDFVAFATTANLTYTSALDGKKASNSNNSSDVYVKALSPLAHALDQIEVAVGADLLLTNEHATKQHAK